jgi:hypothetical protein
MERVERRLPAGRFAGIPGIGGTVMPGRAAGGAAPEGAVDRFYNYLHSVMDVYKDMAPILRDEVAYINADDVAALDETLKAQQALLLKTRNFEAKVAEFLGELGITAGNLSATIAQLPEEDHFRFYAFLGEFDQVMEEVAFYRDKCRELLQSKLYVIDKKIAALGKRESLTYDENAEEVSAPSLRAKTFEKKF